jgi:hypothetical protein
MTMTKKPAGEARERPRPPQHPESHGPGAKVMRKNVGAAPTFDREAKRLTVASEAPKGGMMSNPWVRHWAGLGPAPTAPAAVSSPAAHPKKKAGGQHRRAGGGASSTGRNEQK